MSRWNVLRSEWSPSMGLRQVVVNREPVHTSKRLDAIEVAFYDAVEHMERGGLLTAHDYRLHECANDAPCGREDEHVWGLWWEQDTPRVVTLRLVSA